MLGGGRSNSKPASSELLPVASSFTDTDQRPNAQRSQHSSLFALAVSEDSVAYAVRMIRRTAGDAACDVFELRREMPCRRDGLWTTRLVAAYPGYVFAQVRDVEVFRDRLQSSPAARTVANNVDNLYALDGQIACIILDLGGADHVIRMSVGDIVSGRLVVRTGPLLGREKLVSHVDRHRRSAWLKADGSASCGLRVGLEVVSKS